MEFNGLDLLPPREFSGLSEADCIKIQNGLSARIVQQNRIPPEKIRTVAGVDIAYWNDGAEYAVCCVIVIDVESGRITEKQYSTGRAEFPYIPGCLAFRELPLVVEAAAKIERKPDVFMFDGNGILHTRSMGLAAHASFYLDTPTMGVAKKYFKVDGADYTPPDAAQGSRSDIIKDGKILGRAIRTRGEVKPIFVSVGNYMDIDAASWLAAALTDNESHIPAPTRYADLETHIMRDKLRSVPRG